MYFLTYEYVKKDMQTRWGTDGAKALMGTIFAGGMAGIANWAIGMPADVLKSRLQTGTGCCSRASLAIGFHFNLLFRLAPAGTYNGIRDVFAELMRKEGPLALYKGITPVMLRAFPANAACFIGFDFCMQFLNYVAPNL